MPAVKVEYGVGTEIKHELPDVGECSSGPWEVQDIKQEPGHVSTS